MLVRRRCVPAQPANPAQPSGARADWQSWVEDAGDGAYWGGADLVFEGP